MRHTQQPCHVHGVICRTKAPAGNVRFLCSQSLFLFEGVVCAKNMPACLSGAKCLYELDLMGISRSAATDLCSDACILTLHMRAQIGDSAGKRQLAAIDIPFTAFSCGKPKIENEINASVCLKHAHHIKHNQFYICAQIILTQKSSLNEKCIEAATPYSKGTCIGNREFC